MRDERSGNNPEPGTNPERQGPENRDRREPQKDWSGERRERMERDPLRGLLPGLILILLGVLLFFTTQGTLSWGIWWQYFLIGLGVIFIIDGLAHYAIPAQRDASFGRFIPGVVLIFVGLAFIFGFSRWWPLVLIAAGVIVLLSLFFRKK